MPERQPAPPWFAAWLLHRLCRPRYRDVVEGDLRELFELRLHREGRWRAAGRYWIDVLSLARSPYGRGHVDYQVDPGKGRLTEWIMNLLQDLRQAARSLVKAPAFSGVVVLTLGLAVGANSAIFSVVDGVLLRPLPYDQPESIVVINERGDGGLDGIGPSGASQDLFLEWRSASRSFEQMAMYSQQEATITSLEEPVRLNGLAASPALFTLLRVDALIGRTFTPDEEEPGQDDVVVLGHSAWQRYFGGDPAVVGTQLRLDDRNRTVVGVTPPGVQFPDASVEYYVPMLSSLPDLAGGAEEAARSGAWVRSERDDRQGGAGAPGAASGGSGPGEGGGPGAGGGQRDGGRQGGDGGEEAEDRLELWGRVVARLNPGVTLEMAAEEGTALVRGLRQEDIATLDDRRAEVISMQEEVVGSVRRSLLTLMGAVGFVLLIACANVANLVTARSVERRKEIAVRSALGAGKWTLSRYLFLESLLLALAGGVMGLGLAFGSLRLLGALSPDFIPRLEGVRIDVRVLGFTLLVAVVTAVLFSLIPARGATRLDLTRALKEEFGSFGLTRGLGRNALRKLLVTAEVALSVVLLVGAGLLLASFLRLASVDPGYDPNNLLHLHISLPANAYSDAASHLNYYDDLVLRLEAVPGILSATVASQPPYLPANIRVAMSTQRDGEPPSPEQRPTPVGVRMVENAYFEALRAAPVAGRLINRDDRPETLAVAVLSRSGVKAMFGDRDPVGERMPFVGGQELEIVGVVDDVRTAGVDPTPQADIFLPYRQASEGMVPRLFRTAHVLIRTGPAPLSVLPAVRTVLRQSEGALLVLSAATIRDRMSNSVAEPRFYASLVGALALLALVLAAVGIYGMLSYSVQQGVRDNAIRRALGAPVGGILRRVLSQGMLLAGAGLALGIVAAMTLTRLLESMLYEIEPTDPASLTIVALVFLAVALLAVWIPARRAMRIDPMDVLRYE